MLSCRIQHLAIGNPIPTANAVSPSGMSANFEQKTRENNKIYMFFAFTTFSEKVSLSKQFLKRSEKRSFK